MFLATLENHPGQTVSVKIARGTSGKAHPDTLTLPVKLSEGSKMGIGLELNPAAFYK